MKKYLVLLICLTVSFIAFGQSEMKNVMTGAEVEVTAPQFTGIENVVALTSVNRSLLIKEYLVKKAIYPKGALNCNKEGTEVIKFVVNPDGSLSNFDVINSICREIDDELIRVLKTTNGMWQPGENNGNPVAMEKEVSLIFAAGSVKNLKEIFTAKATNSFIQGNKRMFVKHKYKKALKYYNQGTRYLPYDKGLLYVRGICKYELGDKEGARKDWERIVTLGGIDGIDFDNFAYDSSKMKGYEEMAQILKK